MKWLVLILALIFPTVASAQCTGTFPPNTVCGTVGGGIPDAIPFSGGAGTGTVNPGTATQFAYYATTGSAVSSIAAVTWVSPTLTVTATNAGISARDTVNSSIVQILTNVGSNLPGIQWQAPGGSSVWELYSNGPTMTFFNSPSGSSFQFNTNSAFGVNGLYGTAGQCLTSGGSSAATIWVPCNGVNVIAFGAKCDGSTNDTAAINAAIVSGNSRIIIPGGTCVVTTLTQVPVNVTIQGLNYAKSILQTTSTTGDVLTLSTQDQVMDLGFSSSVTRSSGAMIRIGGGSLGTYAGQVLLRSLFFQSYFDAIHINGTYSTRLTDITAAQPTPGAGHDCLLIDGASGSGQPFNTDIQTSGFVCTGGSNGVEISAAGDVRMFGTQIFNTTGSGILIDPSGAAGLGNEAQWITCTGCLLDTNQIGLNVHPTLGAGVFTVKMDSSWIATNSLWGVNYQTDTGHSSVIQEADLVNDLIANNSFYGVVLNDNSAMNSINISDSTIAGNGIGNNGGGFYFGVGAQVMRLVNNKIGQSSEFGNNNRGIDCSGGASPAESIISLNDMAGNASGSCAWTFTVRINNINF